MKRDRAAYMREYRAKRKLRAGILATFDVTESDLAGLDSDGYGAARDQATKDRAEFVKHLEAEVARLTRELATRPVGPTFSSRPFTPVPKSKGR